VPLNGTTAVALAEADTTRRIIEWDTRRRDSRIDWRLVPR